MTAQTEDRRYEEARLATVQTVIKQELKAKMTFFSRLKTLLQQERKDIWEDGPRLPDSFASAVTLTQQLSGLRNTEVSVEYNRRMITKLQKNAKIALLCADRFSRERNADCGKDLHRHLHFA